MTKKTNSLLFRFGLSLLWKNKSIKNQTIANIIQLENIICKILKKKNLKVLCLYYKNNSININIYNHLFKSKSLKYEIIKYFSIVINITKIVNKFNISKNIIKWFLADLKMKKKIFFKKKKKHFVIPIFWICLNNYIIFNTIVEIKKYNFVVFNKIFWIIKILFHIYLKFRVSKIRIKTLSHNYRLKLRQIGGLIKIKLFQVYAENLILKCFSLFFKVKINNIFSQKGVFLKYFINKNYKQHNFFILFQILVVAILYNNAGIISDYLSVIISSDTNHKRSLKKFITIFEIFFFSNLLQLTGFQLRLNGKLNGKMRKSKYHYKVGKVQLQTLKILLNFSLAISYTKFGTISIKTWLLNGSNSI